MAEMVLRLLRPDGLYPTKLDRGGNKAAKFEAIRQALRGASRVIIATDCDREGQLIGQEILEHLRFEGEVLRACSPPRTRRPCGKRSRA